MNDMIKSEKGKIDCQDGCIVTCKPSGGFVVELQLPKVMILQQRASKDGSAGSLGR